jgi:hypothetical protein
MMLPMNESENTRRTLIAFCAIGTVAGTLLWGSGILLLGLAVTAAAQPLVLALRRRARVRMQPAPVRLRPSGN